MHILRMTSCREVHLWAAAGDLPTGGLVLAGLALLALYGATCWAYPFVAHSRCNGTGKLRNPGRKAWRRCPGCDGTGRRIRLGRRVWGATTSRTDATSRRRRS